MEKACGWSRWWKECQKRPSSREKDDQKGHQKPGKMGAFPMQTLCNFYENVVKRALYGKENCPEITKTENFRLTWQGINGTMMQDKWERSHKR